MDSATLSENGRDGILCPTIHWLKDILLPKLCKWAGEAQGSQVSRGSLRLVPLDQYTKIYQRLKQDFGEKFVKVSNSLHPGCGTLCRCSERYIINLTLVVIV